MNNLSVILNKLTMIDKNKNYTKYIFTEICLVCFNYYLVIKLMSSVVFIYFALFNHTRVNVFQEGVYFVCSLTF